MKPKTVYSTADLVHDLDELSEEATKHGSLAVNYPETSRIKTHISFRLYSLISHIPFPKSYTGKIILFTFFGVYLPLLSTVFYLLTSHPNSLILKLQVLSICLFSTLLGATFTVYCVKTLLSSLYLISHTLGSDTNDVKINSLSIYSIDELKNLMSEIQRKIDGLKGHIRSLEKSSTTDYLTGVYNRCSGEKRLIEDISRAQRSKHKISLVMLDIDDFKVINDRHGHHVGDICLKHAVKVIHSNIRKGDWLMRWGGDEFILVLFDSDQRTSEKIIERICISLREQPASTSQGQINLSLSVGICQYDGKDNAEEFFKKADSALLLAKRLGKSQVVYYPNNIPFSRRRFNPDKGPF